MRARMSAAALVAAVTSSGMQCQAWKSPSQVRGRKQTDAREFSAQVTAVDVDLFGTSVCNDATRAWLQNMSKFNNMNKQLKRQAWAKKLLAGDQYLKHVAPEVVRLPPVYCGGEVRVETDVIVGKDDAQLEARLYEGVTTPGGYKGNEVEEEKSTPLPLQVGAKASVSMVGSIFTGASGKVKMKVGSPTAPEPPAAPYPSTLRHSRSLTNAEKDLVNSGRAFGRKCNYTVVTTHPVTRVLVDPATGAKHTVTVPAGFLCDGCTFCVDSNGEDEWIVHDWLYATFRDDAGHKVDKATADSVFDSLTTIHRQVVLAALTPFVNAYDSQLRAHEKEVQTVNRRAAMATAAGGALQDVKPSKPHFLRV